MQFHMMTSNVRESDYWLAAFCVVKTINRGSSDLMICMMTSVNYVNIGVRIDPDHDVVDDDIFQMCRG